MTKHVVRFLVLSMLTTSLLVAPIIGQVEAATTGTKHHSKKRVRVTHQRVANPRANPYSNNPYEDDFDRKNAGGGGGY